MVRAIKGTIRHADGGFGCGVALERFHMPTSTRGAPAAKSHGQPPTGARTRFRKVLKCAPWIVPYLVIGAPASSAGPLSSCLFGPVALITHLPELQREC